jgi:hypothetical protein
MAGISIDPMAGTCDGYERNSIAENLLRSGKRLADGETIGVEGDVRFAVSLADAGDFVSSPIARLSLQASK